MGTLAEAVKCAPQTSEEEEDERVKCVGGDKSSLTSPPPDQLLPVYCCAEVLSYEDNRVSTFDSGGTEAHPAADAILFQRLVTPHHMTGVTRHPLTLDSLYVTVDHSAALWSSGCLDIIINRSINRHHGSHVVIMAQHYLNALEMKWLKKTCW